MLAPRVTDELEDLSLMYFLGILTSGFSCWLAVVELLVAVCMFSPLRYFEESCFWRTWVFFAGWLSARDSSFLRTLISSAVFLEELKSCFVDDDFCRRLNC